MVEFTAQREVLGNSFVLWILSGPGFSQSKPRGRKVPPMWTLAGFTDSGLRQEDVTVGAVQLLLRPLGVEKACAAFGRSGGLNLRRFSKSSP